MNYYHIKNLRDNAVTISTDLSQIKSVIPQHNTKAEHRVWCADIATDHIFYSANSGCCEVVNLLFCSGEELEIIRNESIGVWTLPIGMFNF